MHTRKPVLYKSSVSSRCPNKLRSWYQLTELAKYVQHSPLTVLNNGVNGGPLVNFISTLDLLVANCDCGACLGDHLVQDMGTSCYEPDGPAMKLVSTHPRQWHAHNCMLAFDWKYFLNPKLVENVYVPQDFGDHLMAKCGKPCNKYGGQPEARIGRDTEISDAFWNVAGWKDDSALCWNAHDLPKLGNADKVPLL